MDRFADALAIVLGYEGGDKLTDDPADAGGLTRWGISQRAHPGVDVRNLTRELAAAIYRRDYWDRLQCAELPGPVGLMLFDAGVNQGAGAATRALQRAVGVTADGVLGPQTIAAAYRQPVAKVIRRMVQERIAQYMLTSGFDRFGKGWLNRAVDCALTAMEWCVEADH